MTEPNKARELAEKILDRIRDVNENNNIHGSTFIESLISAALEEAFERGRKDVYNGDWAIARGIVRQEAYLDAAKIAENCEKAWELFLLDGCMEDQKDFIAKQIRQRAKEIMK